MTVPDWRYTIQTGDIAIFPFYWSKHWWQPYSVAIRLVSGPYKHVGVLRRVMYPGRKGAFPRIFIYEATAKGFVTSEFDIAKRRPVRIVRPVYENLFPSQEDIDTFKTVISARLQAMEGQDYDWSAIAGISLRLLLRAPWRKLVGKPLLDVGDKVFCSEATAQSHWLKHKSLKPIVEYLNLFTCDNRDPADVTPTMIAKSPNVKMVMNCM